MAEMAVEEWRNFLSNLEMANADQLDANIQLHLSTLLSCLNNALTLLTSEATADTSRSELWKQIITAAEMCGNASRQESRRKPIGDSGVLDAFVKVLRLAIEQKQDVAMLQCLRAIGNTCIENDENRQRVLDVGGAEVILLCFDCTPEAQVIRSACGATLNLCADYEPAQKQFITKDIQKSLVRLITQNNDTTSLALQLLSILVQNAPDSFAAYNFVTPLVKLLQSEPLDVELMDGVAEVIDYFVCENDNLRAQFIEHDVYYPLLSFIQNAALPAEADHEDQKFFNVLRGRLVKIAISITLCDANMEPLYSDGRYLDLFIAWLANERDDLRMCGALCLGNMARSDAHCIELIHKHKILPGLLAILRETSDIRTQHAVVSLLKNLCLPNENKPVLGDAGVIQTIAPLLELDTVKPLQFGVVGILKHLCLNNLSNAVRVVAGHDLEQHESLAPREGVQEATPLERLLGLMKRSDEIPIKSEGARVLVNIVKAVWSQESTTSHAAIVKVRNRLLSSDVISPLADLIRQSKYPVLQNEGLIALAVLTTDSYVSNSEGGHPVIGALFTIPTPSTSTNSETPSEGTTTLPTTLIDAVLQIAEGKNAEGTIAYPKEMRANATTFCVRLLACVEQARSPEAERIRGTIAERIQAQSKEEQEQWKEVTRALKGLEM
ncbi:uncharacterized protein VTP21DRAFT_3857 [Calcarisporiella thermophila]|uniref:uncharacterized protein n=1 Tax=Calcarisporiella thermophila TaxID=911321 RepID=UPI00374427F9